MNKKNNSIVLPKVILAPLAGISSLAFRMINRGFGCPYAFLEMIHARSFALSSRKTGDLTVSNADDRPLGIQLLGNEDYYLEKALEKISAQNYDSLDFNAACPRRKVIVKGEGAALLKTPQILKRLLKILVKGSCIPVSAKIRLGWEDAIKSRDIACYAEDSGINAIFVHGRTKIQGYSSDIDYESLRLIKRSLKIPVFASGNIFNASLAKKMFDETGCDGVMVARGALGNPWIFQEIIAMLENHPIPPRPSVDVIAQTMRKHFNLCFELHGEKRSIYIFRKFYAWYTRGISGVKSLRTKIMHTASAKEMIEMIEEFRTKAVVNNAVRNNIFCDNFD
ncbi:MAG: tRNA-dihydrouridine synthase [Candidatus Omnitrophica bacterium]|nr:tRNA-dihydrouridine synthase [Candidatus Omnitrophota bacterium]